jgi:3,4-dihydroxy 2-butanone 4-phosphate synthase/GTP cyclohydrolase II
VTVIEISGGTEPLDVAINRLQEGRMVIVRDSDDSEDEGDLVLAAVHATPERIAFMVRHTSGILCVPMPGDNLDRLNLPPMTATNEDPRHPGYTVSVNAREGVRTGISAADRAHTIRLLADPSTRAEDLTRPGHIFPLRAVEGGVLRRAGHTEAAVDLARLAGLPPMGVIGEVVNDDGTVARDESLRAFAAEHDIAIITITELIARRRRTERLVEKQAQGPLSTTYGQFQAYGFRSLLDGLDHVAMVMGDVVGPDCPPVLVRVHSECLTGDVFTSARCDCGPQLQHALRLVAAEGRGVVLYLRGQEGRGIGLVQKLRAYRLQDVGVDTVDANLELGLPVDARDYGVGAQILADLGVRRMRLLTNNPVKRIGLEAYGLEVAETVRIPTSATLHNLAYLQTKRDRLGHDFPDLPDDNAAAQS